VVKADSSVAVAGQALEPQVMVNGVALAGSTVNVCVTGFAAA
jgi:hypothetical protein